MTITFVHDRVKLNTNTNWLLELTFQTRAILASLNLELFPPFNCSTNVLWHDSAVFLDFVEFSTAQVWLHLLTLLVAEKPIALVTMFSFKNLALIEERHPKKTP